MPFLNNDDNTDNLEYLISKYLEKIFELEEENKLLTNKLKAIHNFEYDPNVKKD